MLSRLLQISSKRLNLNPRGLLSAKTVALARPQVSHTPIRNYGKTPKTPDLIYVPHVFRWLKTKVQLKYLQKTWDPEFTEGAFIYGTTRAVCRITEIIHDNRPEELDNLMTSVARQKLKEVMKTRLTKNQKSIIKLRPEDIKILVPIAVHFKSLKSSKKDCTITLRILALKWVRSKAGPMRLVLVALQTEFQRDYSVKINSNWNISAFDILECVVLPTAPSSR
ncbi:unnamed protein product [Phyllotreta striolata]|uniref:Uncharacterized protein n=1 Tax=Phyllotreta striolata TaxID=444603 RepID=A0A9N9TXE9_PHYSR|nr:unnamed protein product [Phyllotreta striolata]